MSFAHLVHLGASTMSIGGEETFRFVKHANTQVTPCKVKYSRMIGVVSTHPVLFDATQSTGAGSSPSLGKVEPSLLTSAM